MRKKRVWLWEKLRTWERPFWALISDVIDDAVIDAFKASPPKYIVGDNLTWLDDIVHDVTGNFVDTRDHLLRGIRRHYASLRAYHGTRTARLQDFYDKGLIPLDAPTFNARAKEVFLTPEFPELTAAHIDTAIESVGVELRHGYVYFAISQQELIESCGHYMLYGSEYLVAIAAHIKGSRDYRQVLKRTGIPTVFVCDVPLSLISDPILGEFAGQALSILFERVLNSKFRHPQPGEGGGFEIRELLPARCLKSHTHPQVSYDPFVY